MNFSLIARRKRETIARRKRETNIFVNLSYKQEAFFR